MGLLDFLKPQTNTTSTAYGGLLNSNPKIGQAITAMQPKNTPNFQTLSGQNTYQAPPTTQQLQSLGVKANNPLANTKAPTTTIAPKYQSPNQQNIVPPSTTPQIGGAGSGGTMNPNYNMQTNTPVGTQAGGPSQSYNGFLGLLQNTAQGNSAIGQQAADIAANYGQQIADVGQQGAKFIAGQKTTGTTPVAEGNAAITAQSVAAQQQALAQGGQMALQGTQQQLTGQNQQQQGYNYLAGYGQPQLGQYGQGYYNPLDPTGGAASAGGGALNPINNVQSIAQQVLSGQLSPSQAYSMGGSVSNWQSLLNAAIQQMNPNANLAQLEGTYNAHQSNTQTAGTAATNAYANAYNQNYPAYLQVQSQLSNVENLGNLLIQTAQGTNINPFDLTYANQTLNQFRSKLSSNDQAKFNQSLATYAGAVSQLLAGSSSVTPTQVAAWTNGIIDGTLNMSALKAAYEQAIREGNIKLQTAGQLVNTPGSQIGTPQVGANNNPLGI